MYSLLWVLNTIFDGSTDYCIQYILVKKNWLHLSFRIGSAFLHIAAEKSGRKIALAAVVLHWVFGGSEIFVFFTMSTKSHLLWVHRLYISVKKCDCNCYSELGVPLIHCSRKSGRKLALVVVVHYWIFGCSTITVLFTMGTKLLFIIYKLRIYVTQMSAALLNKR